MKLTPVEIDFDIHKLIEMERRSFDEPPYQALRRLLRLPEMPPSVTEAAEVISSGKPWREDLVEVPHGSAARMFYNRGKEIFEGRFLDGKLVVNGQSFDTLSAAAGALARTKKGKTTNLNGWKYWEVKFPGEVKWQSLSDLREEIVRDIKIDI